MLLLKSIPKVDKFIQNKAFENLSQKLVTKISKDIITQLRADILDKKVSSIEEEQLIASVLKKYTNITTPSNSHKCNWCDRTYKLRTKFNF